MALPLQLALVPEGVDIRPSDLTRVASALSKQVNRDFRPLWKVDATVDAFASLDEVPTDYWPIIVVPDVKGAAGYHQDQDGQPYAVVEMGPMWSLTASHECLEMLADPFGRRLRAGQLLPQAVALGLPPRRVNYLVEVCDPSEAGAFGYQVNGVLVSDFYTPEFFDPKPTNGVRYSFTGAIREPRTVLNGGYISWNDPVTRHWMQLRMFRDPLSDRVPHIVDLSTQTRFNEFLAVESLRGAVDRVTTTPPFEEMMDVGTAEAFRASYDEVKDAQAARAESIRQQLRALRETEVATEDEYPA